MGRHGRSNRPIGQRRRTLGRRNVHLRDGYGAFRFVKFESREMEQKADFIRRIFPAGDHSDRRAADLWLYELFSQHRPQTLPERARRRLCSRRQRHEYYLRGPGKQSRRRRPLDRKREDRRIHRQTEREFEITTDVIYRKFMAFQASLIVSFSTFVPATQKSW